MNLNLKFEGVITSLTDQEINDKCLRYQPVARRVARLFSRRYPSLDPDDILHCSFRIMWRAIASYNPDRLSGNSESPIPEEDYVGYRIHRGTLGCCTLLAKKRARERKNGVFSIYALTGDDGKTSCDTNVPAPEADPETIERKRIAKKLIEVASAGLEGEERDIFRLIWVRHLTQTEVGKIFGLSPQATNKRMITINRHVYKLALANSELALYAGKQFTGGAPIEPPREAFTDCLSYMIHQTQERIRVRSVNTQSNPLLIPILDVAAIKARAARPLGVSIREDQDQRRRQSRLEHRKIYLRQYNEVRKRRHRAARGD